MKLENTDRISELTITLKQAKAVMDLFTNEYTSGKKDLTVMSIDKHYESFTHAASVISDLLFNAVQQAEALETAAATDNIRVI